MADAAAEASLAVVLAAGAGRRMGGGSKAFRCLPSGQTFLQAITETCEAVGVGRVCCVLGPDSDGPMPPGLTVLRNPRPEDGMASSVHIALAEVPAEVRTVLIWPVDCPRVAPDTLRSLLQAASEGALIAIPSHRRRRGHPSLFARDLVPALRNAPLEVGVRAVIRAHEEAIVHVETDDPAVLDDFDTLADLDRLQR